MLRAQLTEGSPAHAEVTNRRRLLPWVVPIAIAVAFLVAFFATLDDYGMTWDEAENFYIGERNLQFLKTGDSNWVTFPENELAHTRLSERTFPQYGRELERLWRSSAFDFRPETHDAFVRRTLAVPWMFAPAANTASAVTDEIFYRRTGLLDPIPAHHAAIGLIWAVLLVATYRFTWRLSGHLAAVVACGALAVAPRLWGPVHNNIKDVPQTALFALALLALYRGATARRTSWIIVAGGLAGLAVASKLQLAFVFVVAVGWLFGARSLLPRFGRRELAAFAAALLASAAVFFAVWPYLWGDPIERTSRTLLFGIDVITTLPSQRFGYAAFYAAITTPPVLLALALVGAIWMVRAGWRAPARPGLLLALWIAIPILRVSVPGSGFHDGIRHYMEYWPALAVLAGLGASELAQRVGPRLIRIVPGSDRAKVASAAVITIVALVPSLVADVRMHPFQDAYFSSLVGGLRGARALGVDWATDYWGNSYLPAVGWANKNIERNATIIAPIGGHLLHFDGLRRDVAVRLRPPRSAPRGPLYLAYLTREEFYPGWLRQYDAKKPLFEIATVGVPLLKIYRMDRDMPPFGRASS